MFSFPSCTSSLLLVRYDGPVVAVPVLVMHCTWNTYNLHFSLVCSVVCNTIYSSILTTTRSCTVILDIMLNNVIRGIFNNFSPSQISNSLQFTLLTFPDIRLYHVRMCYVLLHLTAMCVSHYTSHTVAVDT